MQEETYTAEDAGTHELPDREESGRPADVLQRLEAATVDRRRGLEGAERLAELLRDAGVKYGDDYAMNKALRRRLRCAAPLVVRLGLLCPCCLFTACAAECSSAQLSGERPLR